MEKKNFIIAALLVIILVLIYIGKNRNADIAEKDTLLRAANDTLHTYKTKNGNQGAYIATLQGDKDNLIAVLQLKSSKNNTYQSIIDSLKSSKNIKSASVVSTTSNIVYTARIDTVYKDLNYKDTVSTKWYDLGIEIKNSKLGVNLTQRDEINLTTKLVKNKGLFSGSTLTTFAASANPKTNITGVTSVSTIVDKRKLRIGPFVGVGAVINKEAQVSVGGVIGVGISF